MMLLSDRTRGTRGALKSVLYWSGCTAWVAPDGCQEKPEQIQVRSCQHLGEKNSATGHNWDCRVALGVQSCAGQEASGDSLLPSQLLLGPLQQRDRLKPRWFWKVDSWQLFPCTMQWPLVARDQHFLSKKKKKTPEKAGAKVQERWLGQSAPEPRANLRTIPAASGLLAAMTDREPSPALSYPRVNLE